LRFFPIPHQKCVSLEATMAKLLHAQSTNSREAMLICKMFLKCLKACRSFSKQPIVVSVLELKNRFKTAFSSG